MDKKPIIILAGLVIAGLGTLNYLQRHQPGTPVAVTPEAAKPEAVAEAEKPAEPAKPAAEAAKPAETTVAAVEPQPKTVEEPKAETPAAPEIPLPSFDTVRVETGGNAIVAGRAEPGAEITIKHNGTVVGTGVANADGAFVVTPDKPLPEGPGVISIEMMTKDKMVASAQTVAVDVKPKDGSTPMVAVLTPGAPTKVVQVPSEEKPKLEPMKTVNIDSVDYDEKGNMIFGGRGPAGNKVQLYVDNKPYDTASIGGDGTWTLAGKNPLTVGAHMMRADEIGNDGGVKSRVEMPFFREDPEKIVAAKAPPAEAPKTTTTTTTVVAKDAETGVEVKAEAQVQTPAAEAPKAEEPAQTATAEPVKPAEAPAQTAAAEPAKPAEVPAQTATAEPAKPAEAPAQTAEAPKPVEPKQQSSTVAAANPEPTAAAVPDPSIVIQPGNNLWRLSRRIYGKGMMFTVIFEANKDHIRNPNLIYPGQVFVTPRGEAKSVN
jgi:nucleoid-associated protein YgaU